MAEQDTQNVQAKPKQKLPPYWVQLGAQVGGKAVNYDDLATAQKPLSTFIASAAVAGYALFGGIYAFGDGTAINPAVTWANELASGIYRNAAGHFVYAVASAAVTEWKAAEFRVSYLTAGRVVFPTTAGKLTGSANLFWDEANNRLGIGLTNPFRALEVRDAFLPQLVLSTNDDNAVLFQGSGNGLVVTGYTTTWGGLPFFSVQCETPGIVAEMSIYNTSSSVAASGAKMLVKIDSNATGDAYYQLYNGTTLWTFGLDNSDSDNWKISQSATLGTTDRVVLTTGGQLEVGDGTVSLPSFTFISLPNTGFYLTSSRVVASIGGTFIAAFDGSGATSSGIKLRSSVAFSWVAGTDPTAAYDTALFRDTAGSVGQRNGTNAQTFSVYNTYTAGTPDYERVQLYWNSNVAILDTTKNGAGTQRGFQIAVGGNVVWNTSTGFLNTIGISASSSLTGDVNTIGSGFFSATSGTVTMLRFSPSMRDQGTNSTTVAQCIAISPTINYTGATKTGKVNCIYLNPTVTSVPTGLSAGITLSSSFIGAVTGIRFFNTADEDTNTEYVRMQFASNVFKIDAASTGTGTPRILALCNAGGIGVAVNANGTVTIGYPQASTAYTSVTLTGASVGTSGTGTALDYSSTLGTASTSTLWWRGIALRPTINFSNATPGAGKVYLIYLAPTITSAQTGNNAGIAFSSAFVNTILPLVFYNTSDEDTNFERGYFCWSGNLFSMVADKGGTGTARGLQFLPGGGGGWIMDSHSCMYPNGSLTTTMSDGFLNIPGASGPPTGVPNSTIGFPLYWDSLNLRLYCYTGGAWKKSAAFT